MVTKEETGQRPFVIHAGTHKTASSYIQGRILSNVKRLSAAGVFSRFPKGKNQKWKPLVAALEAQRWEEWHDFLKRIPRRCQAALISAEQFEQPIAKVKNFAPLSALLQQHGFRLQIVVFLRDQPDYMNARFVHSTRRLYHYMPFDEYVNSQLKEANHIFDYSFLFRSLLSWPDVDISFLPYGTSLGDPFERLIAHCGWQSTRGWNPAAPGSGNIQPGCKGTWLAQETCRRLHDQHGLTGVKSGPLRGTGGVIRRIAEREGWTNDRYFGFSQSLLERVANQYNESNECFSQEIWGEPWRKIFPLRPSPRHVYALPEMGPEREKMFNFVEEATQSLLSMNRHRIIRYKNI
jgi:hypothetical protein